MDIERRSSGIQITWIFKVILAASGFLAGLVATRLFIVPFTVADDSMAPNYSVGDRLYLLRFITPRKGDVVLLDSPIEEGRVFLKRIIAMDGDTVEVKDRTIYINGRPAEFSWRTVSKDSRILPMSFSYRDNLPIIKLKRREHFIIGDNLDMAMDSRFFGMITEDRIIARVLYKMPF